MAKWKRVEFVKLTVDGVEVDAKECTKCGEVKALTKFGVDKRRIDGKRSYCLACHRSCAAVRRKRANPSGERRKPTKWSSETFCSFVRDNTKGEYKCLSEYEDSRTHVLMRHNVCGHTWEVLPCNFLSHGTRCPMCKLAKTHTKFLSEVESIVGDEYTVLSKYLSSKKHILMRHNVCGHRWAVMPNKFTSTGRRCPACSASRGETRIAAYLETIGYRFVREHRFEECHNKLPLPFDFALLCESKTITIEYDGEHHSRPIDFAGRGIEWAEREFRRVQRNDRIKTEYCRANGIPLIRIDYTQFDEIEAILDRELSALGVIGKRNNTDNNDNTRKEDAA